MKFMSSVTGSGLITLFVCSLMFGFLVFGGCAGTATNVQYEGTAGQITDDMVPIKDKVKKFDFLVPIGWKIEPDNITLPKTLELPLDMKNETGRSIFTKDDRGSMVVWCRTTTQNDYIIEQSLYRISPSSKIAKDPVEIKTPGWNPILYRYDSAIVEKGQKKGFSFFMTTKSQKLTALFGCNYVVVARSATLEDSEEIEDDFTAVLRSLKN